MAKHISLKAELRANPGTTGSKAVRKAGKVPAIIYGRHFAPQTLQLDAHTLAMTLRGGIEHALVDLEIVGGTSTLALIQAVQHHPVKRHIVHLDFHALKEDELMHTTVPIISQGEPLGVKTGGGVLGIGGGNVYTGATVVSVGTLQLVTNTPPLMPKANRRPEPFRPPPMPRRSRTRSSPSARTPASSSCGRSSPPGTWT